MGRWRQVLATHALGTLFGLLVVLWWAWPIKAGGVVEDGVGNAWPLLGVSAFLFGGVAGLLEGLLLRVMSRPRRIVAAVVFAAACFPALWLPLLFLGRWYSDSIDALPSRYLFVPTVGWLLFIAVATAVALAVPRPATRETRERSSVPVD